MTLASEPRRSCSSCAAFIALADVAMPERISLAL